MYRVFPFRKIFRKKNIFKEIIKKNDDNINIILDDIKDELIGIKKGIEIILSVFNDLCLEFKEFSIVNNIIEIIPTIYQINEKYKLECKELYFLFQIKYVFKLANLVDKDDKNILSKFLRGLSRYRYSYQEDEANINDYNDLISMFKYHLNKNENEKGRCIIKILIYEYKKRIKYDQILDILLNILKENEILMKTSQLLFHEIISQYFDGTEIDLDKISDYNTTDHFLILISSFSNNEYIEQILLEVLESKFNAHCMSYTNEINNIIKY